MPCQPHGRRRHGWHGWHGSAGAQRQAGNAARQHGDMVTRRAGRCRKGRESERVRAASSRHARPGGALAAHSGEIEGEGADEVVQQGQRPVGERRHEIAPALARLHLAHQRRNLLVLLQLVGGRVRLRYALLVRPCQCGAPRAPLARAAYEKGTRWTPRGGERLEAAACTGREAREGQAPQGSRYRLSAIGYRLSAIGYRLSAIGCRLSAIGYRLSPVGYRLSATAIAG